MTIELTNEMKSLIDNAFEEKFPCLLGTASKNGVPNISFKGSMMAFSDNQLAFWERSRKGGYSQLQENPYVVVLYRNQPAGKAWRFYGTASVHTEGEIRSQIMERTIQAELDKDPERLGAGVIISISRIASLGGETIQEE